MVVGNIDCELVGRLVEGCAGVVVGSIVLLLVAEPVEGGIEIESDDVGTVVGNIVLLLVVALSVEGGIDTESNEVGPVEGGVDTGCNEVGLVGSVVNVVGSGVDGRAGVGPCPAPQQIDAASMV